MSLILYIFGTLFTLLTTYFYWTLESYTKQSLQHKNVIITGGSSGIGLCTAKQLLQQYQCNIVIIGRDLNKLQSAVNELQHCNKYNTSTIKYIQSDIGDYISINNAIQQSIEHFKSAIDILICCAGQTYPHMFIDIPVKYIDSQVQCNVLGTMYTVKAALPSLKQSGSKKSPSRILIVSSLGGICGVAGCM